MRITKRAVTPDDERFLMDLYATSRDSEMRLAPWSDEQKRAFLDQQGALQRKHYSEYFPQAAHEIVLVDDAPVGRTYIDRTGNEIHFMDICLVPEYRNRGIGQHLIDTLIAESEEHGMRLWCVVSRVNLGSLKFFQRNGFVVSGEHGPNLELERIPG